MEKKSLSVNLDPQEKTKLLMEQVRFYNECRRRSIELAVQLSVRQENKDLKGIISEADEIYKWMFNEEFLESIIK